MATIWKSRGTIGPASTDSGTVMPLWLIEERLRHYPLLYLGEQACAIEPTSAFFLYILIEVTELDEPTARFTQRGFYRIAGLQLQQASFLYQRPAYI